MHAFDHVPMRGTYLELHVEETERPRPNMELYIRLRPDVCFSSLELGSSSYFLLLRSSIERLVLGSGIADIIPVKTRFSQTLIVDIGLSMPAIAEMRCQRQQRGREK